MKNSRYIKIGQLLPLLFFNLIFFIANAQKLPNKQEVSLRAPANINIDGYATEWGNQYQAYNKATEVFYSIANDDNNLYLIIHATKSRIIEKMMEGGVGFTISSTGNKSDKKNVTVLFPLLSLPVSWKILHDAGKTLTESAAIGLNTDGRNLYALDSLIEAGKIKINMANKGLLENQKEIKFSHIHAIIDTIAGIKPKSPYYRELPLRVHKFKWIPLNNKDDIKAMTQFDDKGAYNYELAIPIKYLDLDIKNPQKFIYNITIHGKGEDGRPGNTVVFDDTSVGIKDIDLQTPTDFLGEYILAKK